MIEKDFKMAIQHTKRKVSPKKEETAVSGVVLVGTYKEKQLEWIKTKGFYNYPVRDGDELTDDACRKVCS